MKRMFTPEVGDILRFKNACWRNASGGTATDLRGVLDFKARITKAWEDYETGWRFWAVLEESVTVVDTFTRKSRKLPKGTVVYVGQFDARESLP